MEIDCDKAFEIRNAKTYVFARDHCLQQERYGIEILIESLFRDRTASWVRIVNGINKYVTETSETISLENVEQSYNETCCGSRATTKACCDTVSHSVLLREGKWIDINPERFCQDYFAVSKAMIRLLRHHPSISREDGGAVRFDDLAEL